MLVLGYRDTSAPTTKEQTLAAFYAYTNVYEQECEMAGVVPTTSTVALTSHFIDYLVYVFGVHVFKKKNGLPTLPPLGPKIKAGQVPPPKRVRFCDTPVIIPQRERILPEVPLFSEAAPVPVPVPAPIPTPVREVHLGVPFNRWKNSAPRAVTRQERLSALVPAAAPVPAPRPRVQEEEKKNERPPQTFEERVEASKDLYTLLLDSGIRNAIENGQNPNNPFSGTREIAYDKAMEDFMQCGLSYDVAKEVIRR